MTPSDTCELPASAHGESYRSIDGRPKAPVGDKGHGHLRLAVETTLQETSVASWHSIFRGTHLVGGEHS